MLDTRELSVLDLVSVKQGCLLFRCQDPVLWDENMVRDVDQELVFCELLNMELWHEVQEALLGEGGEVGRDDHDGSGDVLLLHPLCNALDGLYADLGLLWEEDKYLQGRSDETIKCMAASSSGSSYLFSQVALLRHHNC